MIFSQQEVEQFGMAANRINGSPTQMLMDHLASRDFRVRDLIKNLDALGWEYLLLDLKPYGNLRQLHHALWVLKVDVLFGSRPVHTCTQNT